MRRADLGQLGEDVKLEIWNLWYGLDHEINLSERIQRLHCGKVGQSLVGLLLGDALLGYILDEELL